MHHINAIQMAIKRINNQSKLKDMLNVINNYLGSKFVDSIESNDINPELLHYTGRCKGWKIYADFATMQVYGVGEVTDARYILLTQSQMEERDRLEALKADIEKLEILRGNHMEHHRLFDQLLTILNNKK